jgi:polysaccharide pyruvyl transferase WcaK-like protein
LARFTLLSLFPYYTRITIDDLPPELVSRISVFDYGSDSAKLAADEADALVMAGGPLMDIPQTAMILSLFSRFADRAKPRIIESCGIGPLNIAEYRDNVIGIARLATQISLRDHDSEKRLRQWGIKKLITVQHDPARDYIRSLGIPWQGAESTLVTCFLRELTSEYPQATSAIDAKEILTDFLRLILERFPLVRIELLAMHYFPIGNDDRLFARQIADRIGSERITVPMRPLSPSEIAERMSLSVFCVAMRFHSVVFAHTLGAPFIAVDYTAGGKIAGFLRDVDEPARCFDFDRLKAATGAEIEELAASSDSSGRAVA